MRACLLLPLVVVPLLCAPAPARAAGPLTLRDYKATFEREEAKIRTNDTAVLNADAAYLKALADLQASFKQQGDFDNVTAVIAERKRFETTKMVPEAPPADASPAIVKAQAGYRAVLAQGDADRNQRMARLLRSYATALKTYIKVLLEQDKMDEAKEANAEMKRADAELVKLDAILALAAPAPAAPPAATTPGTTPAAPADAKSLPASLRRGLMLYYSFDADEGDKVSDASGNKNDGVLKGAAWTSGGKAGGACSFDGNTSLIDAGNAKNLQVIKSMSAWVKSNANGVRQTIVSKHASANNGLEIGGYYFLKEQDDKFSIAFCLNGNKAAASSSRSTYTDNRWHHVAGVLNPGSGRVDLYVDGENVADHSMVNPGPIKGTDARPCYVGRATWGYGSTTAYSWNGMLDEVCLYDRTLSAEEVKHLYEFRKSAPPQPPGP